MPNSSTKTPLALVNEWAARLTLQVVQGVQGVQAVQAVQGAQPALLALGRLLPACAGACLLTLPCPMVPLAGRCCGMRKRTLPVAGPTPPSAPSRAAPLCPQQRAQAG